MWPRTSCSLSSLTLNIVFGRASVTSPSISIFSSFPISGKRVAGLPALESRLAWPLVQERPNRLLEILGFEQGARHLGGHPIRLGDASLQMGTNDALRGRVSLRRPLGQVLREPHALLQQLVVGQHAVDDVPALQRSEEHTSELQSRE